MWIFKYLACLMDGHSFLDITWKDLPYQYCLHCGKVEAQDRVRENIFMQGERFLEKNESYLP